MVLSQENTLGGMPSECTQKCRMSWRTAVGRRCLPAIPAECGCSAAKESPGGATLSAGGA